MDRGRDWIATSVAALVIAAIGLAALGSSWWLTVRRPADELRFVPLALLSLVAVALVVRNRRHRRLLSPYSVLWAAWLALAFGSTEWSLEPDITFRRAGTLALLFGATAVLIPTFVDSARGAGLVAEAVVAGAALVALASWAAAIIDPSKSFQHAFTFGGEGSVARFRGITENPNTIGSYLVVVLPIAVWLAATRPRQRYWWIAAGLLVTAAAAASISRLPLIIAGVQTIVLAAMFGGRRVRAVLASALAIVVAVVIVGAATSHTFRVKVIRIHTVTSASGRVAAWRGGLTLVSQRPANGWGYGEEGTRFHTYRLAHRKDFKKANFIADSVHDSYIGMGVQLGVPGIAILVALVGAALLAAARKAFQRAVGNFAAWAIWLAIAGGATEAVFESYLGSVGNVLTFSFWLVAALPFAFVGRTVGTRP